MENLHRKGADLILSGLHNSDQLAGQSVFDSIHRLITLEGRIPFNQALESLTAFEQRVVQQAQQDPGINLIAVESPEADIPENSCFVIQEGHIGHVSILMPDEIASYQAAAPLFIAGAVQFSEPDFRDLQEFKKETELQLTEQIRDMAADLEVMEQEGELLGVISHIRENLMRIGPTFVHVGHHIYSTFDRVGKNIIDLKSEGGTRLLATLVQKPVASWAPEEQLYIYAIHLLLISGGPARIEELNGGQISPTILQNFFNEKAQFYCQSTGENLPEDWSGKSLLGKAQWIGEKLHEVNSGYLRYRSINGLILRQQERVMGSHANFVINHVPEDLLTRIQNVFGIRVIEGESKEDYWKRVTEDVIRRPLAEGVLPLPLLIWSIISTAVEKTNSDFGMSSTFRDTYQLLKKGPLNLNKQDFYCCVVPSTRIMQQQETEQVSEAMRFMANRMEFNRWHFIPANIARSQIPAVRDWLYAPAVPDIATQIDLHHGGHIKAGVRHSVRYPSAISVGGQEYNGAYDIRFVRQTGEPFIPEDIITARGYLDALGGVLNTVVNIVENTDQPIRIDEFASQWYRDRKWKEYAKQSLVS